MSQKWQPVSSDPAFLRPDASPQLRAQHSALAETTVRDSCCCCSKTPAGPGSWGLVALWAASRSTFLPAPAVCAECWGTKPPVVHRRQAEVRAKEMIRKVKEDVKRFEPASDSN